MTMELQCFFFNWKIAIGHWPKDQLVTNNWSGPNVTFPSGSKIQHPRGLHPFDSVGAKLLVTQSSNVLGVKEFELNYFLDEITPLCSDNPL